MTLTRTSIRFTASGLEVPAVTAEQMREVDRIAMEETGPNLFQMMENAGRNLAALSMELLGNRWQQASYLVLAGGGGNGGGGICAGRHLANHGCRVSLCLADPEHLGEVPAFQHKVFQSTSGKEIGFAELDRQHPDIILDALIGYGLKSSPVGAAVRHDGRSTGHLYAAALDDDIGASQSRPAAGHDWKPVPCWHWNPARDLSAHADEVCKPVRKRLLGPPGGRGSPVRRTLMHPARTPVHT